MIDFRRRRDLPRRVEAKAVLETPEPTLRDVLRDPIVRSRMAADNIRIRDILDLAVGFRNVSADGKHTPASDPIA